MQTPIVSTQRVFLALWPHDDVREQVAAHARQWTWGPGCVQYLPADWHVTLHFIGNVDTSQVKQIAASAGVRFQAFPLVMDKPSLWPHGLAVLCTTMAPQPLLALYDRLGQQMRELGLNLAARPYQPHITLARHAGEAIPPAKGSPVVWQVQSYALVVSTGDQSRRYQVIRQYQ